MRHILLLVSLLMCFNSLAQSYRPVTGKIEAELYDAISGVGTETTEDTGGGLDVGWMNDNSFVDYHVNVPSTGFYTFKLRIANGFSDNATVQLKNPEGTVFAQSALPRTGGMQGWATVTLIAPLTQGDQTLRIFALKGTFALNWFQASQATANLPDRIEAEDFEIASSVRNESTQDAGGGSNVADIDDNDWMDYNVNVQTGGTYRFFFRVANVWGNGVIQIKNENGTVLGQVSVPRTGGWQNYVTVSTTADLTPGSHVLRIFAQQGAFNLNWFEGTINNTRILTKNIPARIEAENFDDAQTIQTENTGDSDGALNVGSIDDGDWMDYHVNVTMAGIYTLNFRVASANGNGELQVKNANGNVLGSLNVPWTGGWQTYSTLSTTVSLAAGQQILRFYANKGGFNFNWFETIPVATSVPAKLEAETYVVAGDVRKEATQDNQGGQSVVAIDDNDWMDYNIHVANAGTYTFFFRVANAWGNGIIDIKNADGATLGSVNIPRTGGWQHFVVVSAKAPLPAGYQTVRIHARQGAFDFNWMEIAGEVPLLTKNLPGKIEAEDFHAIENVQTEPAGDSDGNLNVGSIDSGDWMDYHVNVQSAGYYAFNVRAASANGNGNLQIKNAAGSVLGQINIPWTGGWQTYSTLTTNLSLPAGHQVIRLYAQNGGFNLNWFEVTVAPNPAGVITFEPLAPKSVTDQPFTLQASSTNNEVPITFTSSDINIVKVEKVGNSWIAVIAGAGSATITASQPASNSFSAAANVARTLAVHPQAPSTPSTKIAIEGKRWYQLTNATSSLEGLFDGNTQANVNTGWGKVLNEYEAYYPLREGEQISIESIKFYDLEGSAPQNPMTLSVINDQWQRIEIASFKGYEYNTWVGPYPDAQVSESEKFKLNAPVGNFKYLVLKVQGVLPTEMEFYGTYTPPTQNPGNVPYKAVRLGDTFGVNGYEWNFELGNNPGQIHEPLMELAKSFSGVRHYMDWQKLEPEEGVYSYNPTIWGGWNYDAIYERCKAENIEVLACLKTLPNWMVDTYPEGERDNENVPVRYGKDFTNPSSYIEQAKMGFQYAARYGSNPNVNPALLSTHSTPRWNGDAPNQVKIGLNLIKYIECDNERDKWWKGRKAYQTAREYAANLSAFYDGHKNTMGAGVGVKNADPNMKVVIAGLVTGSDYIRGMVDWCREFRGYRADGSVNLCWDIVNFHLYIDNGTMTQSGTSTRGAAPEVTGAKQIIDDYVKATYEFSQGMPVWITETGYDVNQGSPLKAIPVGDKSALVTQADWVLRTSLLSARSGIEKVFFYQMYDDNTGSGMFGTSGLLNADQTRRPAADYLYQVNKQFGNYIYKETIHGDPIVDRYELNGKSLYILTVPDETGRTETYSLSMGQNGTARIYTPQVGSNSMAMQELPVADGHVTVTVGETPIFVVLADGSNARMSAPAPVASVLAEEPATAEVTVYPNPTSDFVSIDLANTTTGQVEIRIFDAQSGRLHKNERINKSGHRFLHKVNITHWPTSTYIVEIRQGNDFAYRKIAKL